MQQKKIPMRRCVGCNESKPKKELVRIVRSPEGAVGMDLTGKKSGRGAYLCRDPKCLQKAQKGGRLEKAFACKLSDEVYALLAAEIAGAEEKAVSDG
ncbi:MAG: YlxR family protein [Clostridia bacterium]|nr:YlxR family protein [Clostridia bacterium]